MTNKDIFINKLKTEVATFANSVSTSNGDWVVKGFIDVAKNIYTISTDTKVISKIMELLIFPAIAQFAQRNSMKMILSQEQNFYPDLTLIDSDGYKFAVDIKSTYRKNTDTVNGMTLGAFTGYFRDRKSSKNISFPYDDYQAHIVLGIIYSRNEIKSDERVKYSI
ncbi:MAG: type II restriction endonuclease, partial [Mucinivorans sp.]